MGAGASTGATAAPLGGAVAEAVGSVIFSAICAMKVPRPAMMAAAIKILRITPRSLKLTLAADFIMPAETRPPNGARQGAHFGEKDERSVNATTVIRGLDPRIHPVRKKPCSLDGLPGQARQ